LSVPTLLKLACYGHIHLPSRVTKPFPENLKSKEKNSTTFDSLYTQLRQITKMDTIGELCRKIHKMTVP
jgi:hypothetical protein